MKSLISVVIPAYNLENIIRGTLESVIAQDYPNIEILVINDGSLDATSDVAKAVLEKSGSSYKVIDNAINNGVSCARNIGLKASSGEYVIFLDGDDLFDNNMLTLLHNEAKRIGSECDMVLCGHRDFETATGETTYFPLPYRQMRNKTIPELIAMRILNKMEPALSTLYSKSLLMRHSLRFHEHCLTGEDGEFFIKALSRCKKIGFIKECPYVYIQHDAMGCRQPKSKETLIKRYEDDANAVRRYTKYIAKYSDDAKIHKLLRTFLTPQSCQRLLSVCAMKGEREKFDRYLSKSLLKKLLLEARKSFFLKPEIFLKSLLIILVPSIYYTSYNKRY